MNPGYVRRHAAGNAAKEAAHAQQPADSLWRITRSFRVHVLLATYVNVKVNIFSYCACPADSLWCITRSYRVHMLLATYVNVKVKICSYYACPVAS